MTACDRCEQPKKVLSTLRACTDDVRPNVVAVSLGLRACASGSWWVTAMRLLHDAVKAELELDCVCCDAALGACCAGGHWRSVMLLMEYARKNRLEMEAGGWAAIVTTYVRAGRHQRLRSLVSVLRSKAVARLRRAKIPTAS
ncbi:MRL1 [Symbiodinium natans]|uniref:MRL1 protein n=1 Tax=Symbiodinium natans TaxID=878477 RepID=A0A812THC8_9DINO|nr:MRL1 [Symbiodinium natans]